jgi:putative peptide zinc metalloprotease protein
VSPEGLTAGAHGRITTAWADDDHRPTRQDPQLALILVPRPGQAGGSAPARSTGSAQPSTPQAWVFPFNKPLEPGTGDNQALAVNTTDNTIRYDVAFALVWVEDDSPALNTNEAYAFASCSNCAAVAIGFQVVLVTGENHVAVPQNISAAVNYDCVNCLTYALATQLFVTVDGPLSDASMQQLEALWKEIAAFGANIATVPLDEIQERLTAYETEILDIIESDDASRKPSAPAEATPPDEEAEPSEGASPAAEEVQASGDGGDSADADPDGVEPDPGVVEEPADEGAPETDPATPEPAPSPEAEPSSNP